MLTKLKVYATNDEILIVTDEHEHRCFAKVDEDWRPLTGNRLALIAATEAFVDIFNQNIDKMNEMFGDKF